VKIEEYISSLPDSIITGEEIQLQDNSIRDIFKLANLGKEDIFYHLGCGTGNSVAIALEEFHVKKAIGIDSNIDKILQAEEIAKLEDSEFRCQDILESDMSDASIILFWFSDTKIIESMLDKFMKLKNCKIITIFDPLPGFLPAKVDFPYLMYQTPFKPAKNLKEQLIAIFETECIDFSTAWEHAERYTRAIGSPDAGNDRFLTILQTLLIWINAKNLGLSCTDEVPAPIKNYMEIMQNFFNIEVKHLIK
jgi:hypothetical protein